MTSRDADIEALDEVQRSAGWRLLLVRVAKRQTELALDALGSGSMEDLCERRGFIHGMQACLAEAKSLKEELVRERERAR